jgi:hypothetical protein
MPDDFKDAAIRHFNDALALKTQGSLDNAGHLIGFSAECAIKSTLSEPIHVHLPELLASARKRLKSRAPNSGLLRMLNTNAFNDWDVARRYDRTGNTTAEELDSWVKATKQFLNLSGVKTK